MPVGSYPIISSLEPRRRLSWASQPNTRQLILSNRDIITQGKKPQPTVFSVTSYPRASQPGIRVNCTLTRGDPLNLSHPEHEMAGVRLRPVGANDEIERPRWCCPKATATLASSCALIVSSKRYVVWGQPTLSNSP